MWSAYLCLYFDITYSKEFTFSSLKCCRDSDVCLTDCFLGALFFRLGWLQLRENLGCIELLLQSTAQEISFVCLVLCDTVPGKI